MRTRKCRGEPLDTPVLICSFNDKEEDLHKYFGSDYSCDHILVLNILTASVLYTYYRESVIDNHVTFVRTALPSGIPVWIWTNSATRKTKHGQVVVLGRDIRGGCDTTNGTRSTTSTTRSELLITSQAPSRASYLSVSSQVFAIVACIELTQEQYLRSVAHQQPACQLRSPANRR